MDVIRRSSTSHRTREIHEMSYANQNPGKSRLLAKVIREILQQEQFDSLADLTDVVKFRCARLKVGWTNDLIHDAFRLIASNLDLTRRRPKSRAFEREERSGVNHEAACETLQRLGVL